MIILDERKALQGIDDAIWDSDGQYIRELKEQLFAQMMGWA